MNTTLKTGLAIGALCVVWTFVMGFTGWYKHPTLLNLFWVVVPIEIGCLVWGLRQTAPSHGYWPQVGVGTGASAIAGVIVFCGSLLFTSFAFPQYFEELRAVQGEMLRARGMSDAEIAATQQLGAALQTPFWQALFGLIGTTVTGFYSNGEIIVSFVVLLGMGLYLLHRQSEGYRQQAVWGLFIIVILSFIVFLPLLRYMTENPDIVFYRALTRVGDLERPLPGPAWQIFLFNLRNSLTMFAWDNGEIWPISIPHRPVLDVVTAVFFHIGVLLLILRYIRQRHWIDIFMLLSIPLLMMPSILSLSFPSENPSLNRSAAALVPVFLIVSLFRWTAS